MDDRKKFGYGHKFTEDDVLALITVLTGKMSGKELHLALQKEGVFKKSNEYSTNESTALSGFLNGIVKRTLGECIEREGGSKARKYSLTITQDEAIERLTSSTKKPCRHKQEIAVLPKEEKVEVKEQPSQSTKVIETIQKLDRYFNNPQSYSPKQIEELILGLSGFNHKTVIEAVIESFREVQHLRVEEMCSKFLS